MLKLLFILVYLWPLLHVVISPRASGNAKFGWFVLMFLFSWLAYPFYLLSTQKTRSNKI